MLPPVCNRLMTPAQSRLSHWAGAKRFVQEDCGTSNTHQGNSETLKNNSHPQSCQSTSGVRKERNFINHIAIETSQPRSVAKSHEDPPTHHCSAGQHIFASSDPGQSFQLRYCMQPWYSPGAQEWLLSSLCFCL